nr:serine/threonine-protein kinase PRP4 [Ipomoea batatas]
MFLIKTASQSLPNCVLVTFRTWSKKPPPHDDVRSPVLSIDMSKAKNVPSMPGGQSLANSGGKPRSNLVQHYKNPSSEMGDFAILGLQDG